MLNRTLPAIELNNVHVLVLGGTRMGRFLDGFKQCSDILDTFPLPNKQSLARWAHKLQDILKQSSRGIL